MPVTLPNLQNVVTQWKVPDDLTILIDFVKASGLLQTALVRPSSHGTQHKYKYFNSLPAAAFRSLGAGIAPSALDQNWAKIDLWDCASLAEEDFQVVESYPKGKEGWVAQNMSAFVEALGQAFAQQCYYGTLDTLGNKNGFKGFHQYCTDTNQRIAAGDGTTGITSIFAVRWEEYNGANIRVIGNATNGIDMLKVTEVTATAPALVVTNTTSNTQLPVYAWWLNVMGALIVPSAKSVACIYGVDSTHAPTVEMMNRMLDFVEASSGQTYIYANKLGRRQIASLKDAKTTLYKADMDYNNFLESWRGVPIILDDNISLAETTAIIGK